jgi:hypothetical protein
MPAYKLTVLSTVDGDDEDASWLWPGILPAGSLGMFDGDPGLGKSMVTMDIAARVTRGAKWPDKSKGHRPADVLIIAAEDSHRTMRKRLNAAGANLERAIVLDAVGGKTVKLPRDIEIIKQIVRERKVRLVIIDPIMAFLEVTAYRDQSVRDALSPLSKMCEETGATTIFVRHLTKAGGKNAKHAGGGSMGLLGACRFGYLFAENPDDPKLRVFANTKMNLAAEPASMGYEVTSTDNGPVAKWADETVKWTANDVLRARAVNTEDKAERDEITDFLLTFLIDNGGAATPSEIKAEAKEAGITYTMLRTAKKKNGIKTVQIGRGNYYWTLPDTNRRQLMNVIQGTPLRVVPGP